VPEEAGITQVAGARKHAMANEITGEHVSVKIVDRFSLTEQKKLAFQK